MPFTALWKRIIREYEKGEVRVDELLAPDAAAVSPKLLAEVELVIEGEGVAVSPAETVMALVDSSLRELLENGGVLLRFARKFFALRK